MRDGEQEAGVIFSQQEKLQIARLLKEIGVNQFEVGCPWLCEEERQILAAVAREFKDEAIGFCRANVEDIGWAAKCGLSTVTISISTSDIHVQRKFGKTHGWVLTKMIEAAREAHRLGLNFVVSAEDASRSGIDFLATYFNAAFDEGACRVRFCDTLGILDPLSAGLVISDLTKRLKGEVEMHTHNDFGMATANVIAGLKGGANCVTVTIGGLGERSGSAALEEVVMALRHVEGVRLPIATQRFREVAEYVAEASARAVPIWKAIVGTNIFAHESGIHADAVIKDPRNYEAFTPEEVGLQRQILVGKHSGSHTVSFKFSREFGIDLPTETAHAILARARHMAVTLKRPLFDKELMLIYNELNGEGGEH
ncbi:MAG: homoaconitate hydratase [Chloroflexi bacterium]|nr:homoaconitate hydratase [Chloroflexota bacterium]